MNDVAGSKNCGEWLWSDQISIDQEDDLERGHQVSLMARIFTTARQVFACIRPSDMESLIEDFDSCRTSLHMFTEDYWNRLWIVQELRLARNLVFWYRGQAITREDLIAMAKELEFILARKNPQELSELFQRGAESIPLFQRLLPKIRHLLLVAPGALGHVPLFAVLKRYCHSLCRDPRDKIFGLLAIVGPRERMEIDYTITGPNLMRRALEIMVPSEVGMNSVISASSTYRGHSECRMDSVRFDTGHKIVDGLADLELKLALTSQTEADQRQGARAMFWAYMVSDFPRQMRDRRRLDPNNEIAGWRAWAQAWDHFMEYAITSKQKLLAEELYHRSHQYLVATKPGLSRDLSLVVLSSRWESGSNDRKLAAIETRLIGLWHELESQLPRAAEDIIAEASTRYNFRMYGDFLYHPEDWLLPGVKHQTVRNYFRDKTGEHWTNALIPDEFDGTDDLDDSDDAHSFDESEDVESTEVFTFAET